MEILLQVWGEIYEEYVNLLEDAEQLRIMAITKEINLLDANYARVELIVRRLSMEHSDEIVALLKNTIHVRSPLTPGPNYLNELNAVLISAGRWLVDKADREKELKESMPTGGVAVDRKYFDRLITSVSKHMKFRINKNEITTAEFASFVRDMRETYDEMSKQKNGNLSDNA